MERAGYQVKHLMVAPRQAISLQRHRHRGEHWVVLRGRRGHCDDKVFTLRGEVHADSIGRDAPPENPSDEELHVVEVQLGDYLGEDDIERLKTATIASEQAWLTSIRASAHRLWLCIP